MFLGFDLGVSHIPKTLQGGNRTHATQKSSRKSVETYEDFGLDPGSCTQSSLWVGTYMTVFVGPEAVNFPAPQKPDPQISQRALNPLTCFLRKASTPPY